MDIPTEALTSVAKAAARLGISRNGVQRHLPTIKIGRRILVRISDVEAKIAEGQPDAA